MTEPMLINCGLHGQRTSAVVCKHLLASAPAPAGFIENSDEPNDLQAWCARCEEKFEQEGEMTEEFRAFNGMAVVCVVCYGEAKSRHSIPAS
jgi:hypothetical protein